MQTRFTDRYRLDVPIACAGMSFAAGPALAVAVTRAGGLGALGTGYLTPAMLRTRIRAVRAETSGPLNVNFTIFHTREHLDVCVEERVPVVSFHWELPAPEVVEQLHAAGIDVWQQTGNPRTAVRAVERGCDLVIAQGSEAGGHQRGELPLFALLPEVRRALPAEVPVLAAGGITTGGAVVAALALGADGVYVGTRFVASTESDAHPRWKQELTAADAGGTVLTSSFGPDFPDFNPMRVLRNAAACRTAVPADRARRPVGELVLDEVRLDLVAHDFFPPTAASSGDFDELPLLAGQGVGTIDEVVPAARIVTDLVEQARQCIERLAATKP